MAIHMAIHMAIPLTSQGKPVAVSDASLPSLCRNPLENLHLCRTVQGRRFSHFFS
jgi:hypothetical protein